MSYTSQQIDTSNQFIISMIYNFLRVHNRLVKDKKENQRIFNSFNKITMFFVTNYMNKTLDAIFMPCLIETIVEVDKDTKNHNADIFQLYTHIICKETITEQDKKQAEQIFELAKQKYKKMTDTLGLLKNPSKEE